MPNKLEIGFVKADSTNLPKVNVFMIWDFLMESKKHNIPEVRGIQATVSSRENYGDSAIGYVCLKRSKLICQINAQICPEHRVRKKNYNVVLKINENEEKIISVECLDCAASEGGCKHGIAFVFRINRRYENASPTEIECYWRRPPLSAVGTDKKFITASELSKKSSALEPVTIDTTGFLSKLVDQATIKQIDSQLSRYTYVLKDKAIYSASIHRLLFNFTKDEDVFSDFNVYMKKIVTPEHCKEIEEKTRNQTDDPLWYEMRFGRLTASNIYEASRCQTPEGSLVNRIIGIAKSYESKHMRRGKELEPLVISEIEKVLNIKIERSGLHIIPSLPMLGASSDGVCSDFIVEVKCPCSEKNINNYLSNGEISKKVKGQMNLQMLATGKKKGLLCVADPDFENNKIIYQVWDPFDEDFTNNTIESAVVFWEKHVLTYLMKTFM